MQMANKKNGVACAIFLCAEILMSLIVQVSISKVNFLHIQGFRGSLKLPKTSKTPITMPLGILDFFAL